MGESLKPKKKITEISIYKSLIELSKYSNKILTNINRDFKQSYMTNILNLLNRSIIQLKDSYNEQDKNIKFTNICKLRSTIENIDITYDYLFDSEIINEKNHAHLKQQLGEILLQINGWKTKTKDS